MASNYWEVWLNDKQTPRVVLKELIDFSRRSSIFLKDSLTMGGKLNSSGNSCFLIGFCEELRLIDAVNKIFL